MKILTKILNTTNQNILVIIVNIQQQQKVTGKDTFNRYTGELSMIVLNVISKELQSLMFRDIKEECMMKLYIGVSTVATKLLNEKH